jgi:cellobiose phosphorylase
LTLDLYIQESGDFAVLFEETAYFRDHQIHRAAKRDYKWQACYGQRLKTAAGKIYKGTILEHILVQHLTQFFNAGSHNFVRLEGADWNDGLDMAQENGESVAFSCMYAHNLRLLAGLLLKIGKRKISLAKELRALLAKTNYNDIKLKQTILNDYFVRTRDTLSGEKIDIDVLRLAADLLGKVDWLSEHIRKDAWLKPGFFNGYYDNRKKRVEGASNNLVRMLLASQVFPIMSGVARDSQIKSMWKSMNKYLLDKKLKGYHLNTDFKEEQHNLGRSFSFVYGDKENGAFFNHMVVMLAYGLYKRGFIDEGWQVLKSISDMAMDSAVSKIYPCLPEYFNLEGRGMYSYLTGSASWFVLTLLTEVFGVKGRDGDLCVEPKIHPQQFSHSQEVSVERTFAGKKFQIKFSHLQGTPRNDYKIIKARLNGEDLAFEESEVLLVKRKHILRLPGDKINTLDIILGSTA